MIVEIRGRKINFREGQRSSEIKNLIYIHGSGGNGEIWRCQLDSVGGYAIDLPGHGESDDLEIKSVEDYADVVAEAVMALGIEKAIFAGHSLGGAIVQMLYFRHPEIVDKLILVGTGARLRVHPKILNGLKQEFEATADMLVEWMFSKRFENKKVRQEVREEIIKCGSEITLRDFVCCDNFDLLEDYKDGRIKVDVPVLLLVGTDDIMTPPKYSEFFRQVIPQSKMVVVEGAGHMIMVEKPREVSDAIKEFVG
jgi:pimeloyl-ACP methyl ester carboxylesterase